MINKGENVVTPFDVFLYHVVNEHALVFGSV